LSAFRLVDAPLYVVHVMAAGAAAQVAAARAAGQRVVGEAVLSGKRRAARLPCGRDALT
jgi:hypothetical protein